MDVMTGEISYEPVTEIHTNQFDPVGAVTLLDESDGSETVLSVTASHPFYSAEGAWVHASKLNVGEKLVEDGGETLTVTSVAFNPYAKSALTYNLTVADYHTYFVGEDGVLVHNGGKLKFSAKTSKDAYKLACKQIGGCDGMPKYFGKFGSPSRGNSQCGIRLDPADSHG